MHGNIFVNFVTSGTSMAMTCLCGIFKVSGLGGTYLKHYPWIWKAQVTRSSDTPHTMSALWCGYEWGMEKSEWSSDLECRENLRMALYPLPEPFKFHLYYSCTCHFDNYNLHSLNLKSPTEYWVKLIRFDVHSSTVKNFNLIKIHTLHEVCACTEIYKCALNLWSYGPQIQRTQLWWLKRWLLMMIDIYVPP